ncbi:MAG: glycosyltransferase family 4 protein [Nitrososphaeria archaeon]
MSYKPAGGSIPEHVYQISKRLIMRGHDLTIYTTDLSIPYFKSNVPSKCFKIVRLHYSPSVFRIYRLPFYLNLIPKLVRENFNIIHAHEYCPITEASAFVSKLRNVPLVVTTHGLFSMMIRGPKLSILNKSYFVERLINKIAKRIICVSKADAYLLQSHKIAPLDKISVIPNGVDVKRWSDLPNYGHFRQTYKINADDIIITCIGVITWRKGFQYAISAMKYLSHKIAAKLVIAGPDIGYLNTLKKLVKQLKLEGAVIFTGPLSDLMLKALYRDCDVFLCPSIYDPYPLVITEAMACAKPIVATKVGGIPELITDGVNGLLVKPCNPKEIANAVIKLLEDPEVAYKLGKEAYRTALNLSWDSVVNALEKIYYDAACDQC